MSNETTTVEGPLLQIWTVEQLVDSHFSLGVEHLRSMTMGLVSSASITGVMMRYYLNAGPMKMQSIDVMPSDVLIFHDVGYFLGVGGGIGQSSQLPDATGLSSNAAGFGMSFRAGAEYQIKTNWGVRAELVYGMLIAGKGAMSMQSLGATLYWLL